MTLIKRKCDFCGKEYMADTRNLNRGWGLCCSKSCAAKKRERNRKDYDPHRVAVNNNRRKHWNDYYDTFYNDEMDVLDALDGDQWGDMEIGIHD